MGDNMSRIIACNCYIDLNNLNEAYKIISSYDQSLDIEICLTKIQLLLIMNRLDLAKNELRKIEIFNNKSPLYHLAYIWITIKEGNGFNKTYLRIEKLICIYDSTPMLLNLGAVSQMQMGNFDKALKSLIKANSLKNTETIKINYVYLLLIK